ncbi:MAG: hypothetical protein JSV54_08470 [Chloroflexota bacterium]|nr:MAG: hypothetical protein JSV54_08470 [Chloroflexota bacterium]
MFSLGRNVGYDIRGILGFKQGKESFNNKQREAWEFAKKAIDQGIPCYGWELEMPEYYVILGYDDTGYYYSGPGCDFGKGPKPWQELGDTGIGLVEMYSVRPGQAADDARTVKEALEFALEHAEQKWAHTNYKAGLAGFDKWINTLEVGTANGDGMAYNTAVWAECRGFGTRFLREARARLNGKASVLLKDAAEQYEMVFQHLKRVAELFPMPSGNEIDDEERCNKAVAHLRNARNKEEVGLELLGKIVKAL